MRVSRSAVLFFVAAVVRAAIDDDDEEPSSTVPVPACTATSSSGSGAFFDLRPDIASMPEEGKNSKTGLTKDYYAKGYDYGRNFTLNICASVVESVHNVVGLADGASANVSAYYQSNGDIYSIGSESKDLQSRGRKLVLQYTGGSPCGRSQPSRRNDVDVYDDEDAALVAELADTQTLEDGDDDEDGWNPEPRRKSTTISFLCDRDPASASQATIAFVGTDPDECAYFFEARSIHACAHAEPHKPGSVGPGSIFGLILVITVIVYVLGGVFYNRTVTHARGWRQLPNYSLWAGIWSFICVRSSRLKPDLPFR